jgi:hypothetical protein
MAAENDLVLDKIDQYKKRSRAAFLLCAEILGGLALLGLEAGLVVKAWELNLGTLAAPAVKAAGVTLPDTSVTIPDDKAPTPCSCNSPIKTKPVRITPGKKAPVRPKAPAPARPGTAVESDACDVIK